MSNETPSENIAAAHDALNALHSDECGCVRCVQLYRAALLGIGLELRTVRAILRTERAKSEQLEQLLKTHIEGLPGEGGIRLHSIAQYSDAVDMLYFTIHTPQIERQLMLGIEFTNWMVLSLQVAQAMEVAEAERSAEKPKPNRSN